MAKKTQKDKVEQGMKGESLITDSLRPHKIWNYKMPNAGYGTPFDKLIIPPGGGYAIEVKTHVKPTIPYSKITENERMGLEKFMAQVGKNNAFIIGIWLTDTVKRAFLIPWYEVGEAVCSGARGSINMLDFSELQRKGTGWDMSKFKERRKIDE